MQLTCSINIAVVVACADRSCRQSRIVSYNQGSCICIREFTDTGKILIFQYTALQTLLHGTSFKLGLIVKVGRAKLILWREKNKSPRVPPSYRCSLPLEIMPWAPFELFTSLLSLNH